MVKSGRTLVLVNPGPCDTFLPSPAPLSLTSSMLESFAPPSSSSQQTSTVSFSITPTSMALSTATHCIIMSTGKRIAKRSIVGTRVSVPMNLLEKGLLYVPAVVNATRVLGGETIYSVVFNGCDKELKSILPQRKEFRSNEMIGPGFGSVSQIEQFTPGQKVYLTYNGRETAASVITHEGSEVVVEIDPSQNPLQKNKDSLLKEPPPIRLIRRLEDLRLMESRKSARLQETEGTDYQKLAGVAPASGGPEGPGSISIWDLEQRQRTSSISSSVSSVSRCFDGNILGSPSSYSSGFGFTTGRKRRPSDSEDIIMDDCAAAMVLMSLSCSPKSPLFLSDPAKRPKPEFMDSGVLIGSLFDGGSGSFGYQSSRSGTPSPPNEKSSRIKKEQFHEPEEQAIFSFTPSLSCIIFECTYPGCGIRYKDNQRMESHVRDAHLSPEQVGEEDFYYTEIEVTPSPPSSPNSDQTHSDQCSSSSHSSSPVPSPGSFALGSSAPTWSHLDMVRPPSEDPKYLKLAGLHASPLSLFTMGGIGGGIKGLPMKGVKPLLSSPINIPGVSLLPKSSKLLKTSDSKAVSLLATPSTSVATTNSTHSTSISPKEKKGRGRGDTKKCRKVYGMDARDQWCTQCKWKKACTRFSE